MTTVRVGCGWDIHPLVVGRKLILSGLEIPHSKGLQGHSDSDALVHAMCDALLGAMGEGDLGRHYPSSDQRFRDISSLRLLEDVVVKLRAKGYRLSNVDSTIIAQAPRLSPYHAQHSCRNCLHVESHRRRADADAALPCAYRRLNFRRRQDLPPRQSCQVTDRSEFGYCARVQL